MSFHGSPIRPTRSPRPSAFRLQAMVDSIYRRLLGFQVADALFLRAFEFPCTPVPGCSILCPNRTAWPDSHVPSSGVHILTVHHHPLPPPGGQSATVELNLTLEGQRPPGRSADIKSREANQQESSIDLESKYVRGTNKPARREGSNCMARS
jgi:hypothetical protein